MHATEFFTKALEFKELPKSDKVEIKQLLNKSLADAANRSIFRIQNGRMIIAMSIGHDDEDTAYLWDNYAAYLLISNGYVVISSTQVSKGKFELEIEIPWRPNHHTVVKTPLTWSFGGNDQVADCNVQG